MLRLTSTTLLLALAAPAFALTPTFTKIADNTTTPGDFFAPSNFQSAPVVNDAGVAAFVTQLPNPVPGFEGLNTVYSGNGGPVLTVSQGFTSAHWPEINNAGTVLFSGYVSGNPGGLFARTGSAPVVTIVQDGLVSNGYVSANGNLVYNAALPGGGYGVYRTTSAGGGPVTTIAQDSNPLNRVFAGGINNAGTVSYSTYNAATNSTTLHTHNGVTVTDYVTVPTNTVGTAETDINNAGTIALVSLSAITKWDSPASSTIYAQTGPVFSSVPPFYSFHGDTGDFFGDTVGIADNGKVAFGATCTIPAGGGDGIFVGPDAVADKVIKTGDPLFGSTLSLFFFQKGISDDGQHIAFAYKLANGQSGVAVATLPEPAGIALLMLGGAGVFLPRRLPPTP